MSSINFLIYLNKTLIIGAAIKTRSCDANGKQLEWWNRTFLESITLYILILYMLVNVIMLSSFAVVFAQSE